MSGVWTCQRVSKGQKCGYQNPKRFRRCIECGKPRPKRRQPAHRAVLHEMPREHWEALYGTVCNICGAEKKSRALHRDHCHATGAPRGILCARCNRALPNWVTPAWLRDAAAYLERQI